MDPSDTLLLLGLLALAPGPLLYGASRLSGRLMAAVDGFLLVATGGFVLLHLLPAGAALAGWVPATAALAAGLWLPALAEPRLPSLRRLVRIAVFLLGAAALAAAGGFPGLPAAGLPGWGLFQALASGLLLHLVRHRAWPLEPGVGGRAARPWQSGLGALAGLALVWAVTAGAGAPGALAGMGGVFYALALESAPALLIAYVGAGLVYALLPQGTVDWMGRGSRLSQAGRGMAFGLPLPVCSCGVVPLYRSIVVSGVPPTAAMAFLIATPELSLDAVLISLPLLGGEFTVVRVAAAAAVALGTGWFVGRFASRLLPQGPTGAAGGGKAPLASRLRTGLAHGLGEVVDATAPWIVVGLALAALAHGLIGSRWSQLVPPGFEVEIMALVGMPVYVCAAGATPLVAVLVLNGVSPGAALAFLITGPATNVTTLGVLTQLHGRRIALLFAASVVVITVLLGRAVNGLTEISGAVPDLEHGAHGAGWRDLCLAALGALALASVMRQGPRAFVGKVLDAGGAEPVADQPDPCGESEPEPDGCAGPAAEAEPGCCGAATAPSGTRDGERAAT